MRSRVEWVDAARGIAIILVVFGHVVIAGRDAELVPEEGAWRDALRVVYTFHMPAFMFLSGLFVQQRLEAGARPFLRGMLPTIVRPYLVWGALILLAEQLGKGVRSDVNTSAIGVSLLWTPIAWLWFLCALAIFHGLAVLTRRRPSALIAIGALAMGIDALVELAHFEHQLCHFLIFYALGVVLGPRIAGVASAPSPALVVGAAIGVLALAGFVLGEPDPVRWYGPAWSMAAIPASVAGVIGLCALAMQPAVRGSGLLRYLGRRSLSIYVSHIFFAAAARIALTRVLGVTGFFPAVFVFSFAAGLVGPLALYEVAARLGVARLLGLGKPRARNGTALATRTAFIVEA